MRLNSEGGTLERGSPLPTLPLDNLGVAASPLQSASARGVNPRASDCITKVAFDIVFLVHTISGVKMKICFVCTGNATRSQMAEAFAKKLGGDKIEVYSAGSHPLGYFLPQTIQVMKEAGLDISGQRSKHLSEVPIEEMDYVITLCDSAAQYCPGTVPFKGYRPLKRLHWPFEDPGNFIGDDEAKLQAFRQVRDAIHKKLANWLKTI